MELRKIIDLPPGHNAASPRLQAVVLCVALALTLPGAGCGGDSGGKAGQPAAGPQACPVSVDLGAWQAFCTLGARLAKGETPPAAELVALGEEPSFALWRASLAPNVPPAQRVGNWAEEAFWAESGRDNSERKMNADLRTIGANYRWAWDRRARVDSLAALLAGPEAACALLARTTGWIDADRLPVPLPIHVVPGKPELRYHEGHVFVDTGVLAAGLPSQLERQLAGLLYRNLQAEDGASPLELVGDLAVAHCFRILRNEGIATWIEDLPHTFFDPGHPRLRQVRPVPEFFYESTLRTIALTSEGLPRLFADPAEMTAQGATYARTIAGSGGFNQGGYGMAALIHARLGAARLQAAARSVTGFVAAYQEAALLNGTGRPTLGAAGHEPWEALGPIAPDVYDRLLPLLERVFGPAV